jgi:hypothetical protein
MHQNPARTGSFGVVQADQISLQPLHALPNPDFQACQSSIPANSARNHHFAWLLPRDQIILLTQKNSGSSKISTGGQPTLARNFMVAAAQSQFIY